MRRFREKLFCGKLLGSPLAAVVLAFLSLSVRGADFSGSATVFGAKVDFTGVAATNWINGELVLKYTTVGGAGGFTLPGFAKAQVLAVGGGGAGGSGGAFKTNKGAGGGGGAGGLITREVVFADGTYSVSVGKGGEPGAAGSGAAGGNGDDTTISLRGNPLITAAGGGGGGAESDGKPGGSGGGGSKAWASSSDWSAHYGGAGTDGQGNKGGDHPATSASALSRAAAGGGGAGGAGANVTTANVGAAGGAGAAVAIWAGTNELYAAGGGGGTATAAAEKIGLGGSGIGGNGGGGTSGTGIPATPGRPGTGSGGGGGTFYGSGAAGGSGVVIVRITAALTGPLVRPGDKQVSYDGESHVLVEKSFAYTVRSNGREVDKVEGTNAGSYVATVKLETGFAWDDGGDEAVTITLTIDKADVVISDLKMPSWAVKPEGEDLPEPTCKVSLAGVNPVYTYGTLETGEDATEKKPTQPGDYFVFAEVKPGSNWNGAKASAAFQIFEQPASIFEDRVTITLKPYEPAAGDPQELTNFPYRIVLSPEHPVGFDYVRAGATGKDICFADAEGNVLNHEVISWDPNGESVVYVRLPLIGGEAQTITLHWKPVEGKTPPAYDPDPVWSDWTQEKADAFDRKPSSEFGVVETDGRKIDYWVDLPEISKTSWGVTTDPSECGVVTTNGSLRSGRATGYVIYNAETGEALDPQAMPMAEGVYYLLFSAKSAAPEYDLRPPTQRLDIRVIARAPYDDLSDGAATITLGGRVLLANADTMAGHALGAEEGQAYWQVASIKSGIRTLFFNPFWTHEGDQSTFQNLPYMWKGTEHRLNWVDDNAVTNVLWRLTDCRFGNHYDTDKRKVSPNCYLPTSPTALGISTYANRSKLAKDNLDQVGTIMMRNSTAAAVCSPCYTNGIGTIYLDAVNALITNADKERYGLRIEVATETKDGLPPTDENAGEELENITDEQWKPCDIIPLRCVNGSFGTAPLPTTNEVVLANMNAGTDRNFYRLCVKINKYGTMRFRIRRSLRDAGDRQNPDPGIDGLRYILLDNIFVSFPSADVIVEPHGTFREDLHGKQTLGWGGAMASSAFPAVGEDILARAKATVTNSLPGTDTSTYIQLTKFHYQWHYLGQASNGWDSVDLRQPNGFVADQPLKLPAEPGDVEFWLETYTKIPFFNYVDYSGSELRLGDLYTEEVGMKYWPGNALDGGRGFIRLREGRSEWDGISVRLERVDAPRFGATVPMELVGDGQWRGLVRVPTNVQGEVKFYFEGGSRWLAGAVEPVQRGKVWYPTAAVTDKLPARGETSVGGEPRPFTADGATGFFEFQFNEETGAFMLGHAEYQSFNSWHDAMREDKAFVGTWSEASGVSIEAMVHTNAHMSTWEPLRVTDPNWDETFYLPNYEIDAYKKFVTYKTHKMPTQWNGDNGKFVDEKLTGTSTANRQKDAGIAWQMQGSGLGSVYYTQSDVPNGLDKVAFKARLAQSIDFTDIAYCYGDGLAATNNYTFVLPALLSYASSDGKTNPDFSPGASMSLVGYYTPMQGCYEFRVARDDNANLRFSVYKWYRQGYRMTSELIGTHLFSGATFWHQNGSSKPNLYGMFISLGEEESGKTTILAGLTKSAAAPSATYSGSSYAYRAIRCIDGTATRLKSGTYGALTTSCNGLFLTPRFYSENVTASSVSGDKKAPATDDKSRAEMLDSYYDTLTVNAFPGSRDENRDWTYAGEAWATTPGRVEAFVNTAYGFLLDARGFRPPADLGQTVDIYLKASNTGSSSGEDAAWTLFDSKEVTSYGWKDYTITVRTNQSCHVMLKPGDAPADITIHTIAQTAWNGADMSNPPDRDFIYTQATVYDEVSSDKTVTNRYCKLQPSRAVATKPLSIRSPLLEHGVGMIGFKYKDLKPGAEIWVQMSTNEVTSHLSGSYGLNQTLDEGSGPGEWETLRKYTYEELAATDVKQYYIGAHDRILHPLVGVLRILVAPSTVQAAAGVIRTNPDYGSITITDIWTEDEPALDTFSWLGWNLRVLGDREDSEHRMYLPDPDTDDGTGSGLSSALNNSTSKDIPADAKEGEYSVINPTIQSPMFRTGAIGYVRFRARVYDNSGVVGSPATVTLYGTLDSGETDWQKLSEFTVDSPRFREFEYRAGGDRRFTAVRLSIDGVIPPESGRDNPARVLLDEMVVSEKTEAAVGFAYARPFRTQLDEDVALPEAKILGKDEQPLTGESWGIQAKLKVDRYDKDIDFDSGFKVKMRYFVGESPWGYEGWRDDPAASREVELLQVEAGEDLVFRSTTSDPRTILKPVSTPNTVVQYVLTVYYKLKDDPTEYPSRIAVTETLGDGWTNPTWYAPIDKNAGHGDKIPYTILDGMSPGRAWINEVNYNDGTKAENGGSKCVTNQFIEIAVPWGVDMKDWYVVLTDYNTNKVRLAKFGYDGLGSVKESGEHSGDYGFVVLQSPETRSAGGIRDWRTGSPIADATWTSESLPSTFSSGTLQNYQAYQLELFRPSGILEHQFVIAGTNEYRGSSWAIDYEGTNLLRVLNETFPSPRRFYVGEDLSRKPSAAAVRASIGVTGGAHGEEGGWSPDMKYTPGRLNENQDELSGWYIRPTGGSIWVFASVDEASRANVRQRIGDDVSQDTFLVISSGGKTNITYDVAPWFAVNAVGVNERGVTNYTFFGKGQGAVFTLNNVTETTYVVAREDIDPDLIHAGLDPADRYTPAVMKWLRDGSVSGRFAHPEGPIRKATYRGLKAVDDSDDVTIGLKGMYWLDIDPTEGGWWLRGGFIDLGLKSRIRKFNEWSEVPYSDPQIGVKLYLSNAVSKVVHAPERLQGLNNERSDEPATYSNWTSVTFKVEAALQNGKVDNDYLPFRWFVFDANSFVKPEDAEVGRPAYSTKIEILDPFSMESPGYSYGWRDYPDSAVFLRWNINELLQPSGVETLKADSSYDGSPMFK